MRRPVSQLSWVIASVALLTDAALAQQPPDVVVSDTLGNTAMGTAALYHLSATPGGPFDQTGAENTAVGNGSMVETTGGRENTAVGYASLEFNVSGRDNVAFGVESLFTNTTGGWNTAVGDQSLYNNTSGNYNTGLGAAALYHNTTGTNNTAIGNTTLAHSTTASDNVALGAFALEFDTAGEDNSAFGSSSLQSNTTGDNNTANGFSALYSNTTGASNTADGHHALYANTTGYHNTADGADALFANKTGVNNTALGLESLYANTTGSNNIAVGVNAGFNLTTGSNNIDIGSKGTAAESGAIRIGTAGTQTATYVAGVSTAHVTGAAVFVTSSGQLGVLASSERYKTAIAPIGKAASGVQRLRPVSFHLKTDPNGALQYGLIAEEVNAIYPNLVIRDEAGVIQGVRYDELAPLLLTEVQAQRRMMLRMQRKLAELEQENHETRLALRKFQAADALTASR